MSVDPANPTVIPTSVPPTTPVESDLDPDAMDDEDAVENKELEEKLIHEQPNDARPQDWNQPPTKEAPEADEPTPLSDEMR